MQKILTLIAITAAYSSFAANTTDSSQFYFNKGMQEKTVKHFAIASRYFEKAISFNSKYTEAYLANAYTNMEMKQPDKAKANFVKVYELQPGNSVAINELTHLYFSYRQWNKAIELANKCKDCDDADRIIGMSLYEKEEFLQAEQFLQKAIAKSPEDAEALYALARTEVDLEEYNKAVPYFEKAVRLNPSKSLWAYELGLLYYTNNNYKGAVKLFETALANNYNRSEDFNENYGYALLYTGNYDKGEENLMNVYRKKPANKIIVRDLAQILYTQKQYDRSLVYCQMLMDINPKDGVALYQAGLNFIKKGQKEKGQAMCDKGIELEPALGSKKTKIEMGF